MIFSRPDGSGVEVSARRPSDPRADVWRWLRVSFGGTPKRRRRLLVFELRVRGEFDWRWIGEFAGRSENWARANYEQAAREIAAHLAASAGDYPGCRATLAALCERSEPGGER